MGCCCCKVSRDASDRVYFEEMGVHATPTTSSPSQSHHELPSETPIDMQAPPPAYQEHDNSRTAPPPPPPTSSTKPSGSTSRSISLANTAPPHQCEGCGREMSSSSPDDSRCQCTAATTAALADSEGVDPENPLCQCGRPSRCLITSKVDDRRYFYRCATGDCWFFEWQS